MSPEHQEFLNAFTAEDQPEQPAIPDQPKSEYEQAFADLTKPDAPPPSDLTTVAGEASPAALEGADQVSGVVAGAAAVSSKAPASPKGKKMPSMPGGGSSPQIKPDRSADEYISSFNSMARADEADRAATARSTSQEAARLAGK